MKKLLKKPVLSLTVILSYPISSIILLAALLQLYCLCQNPLRERSSISNRLFVVLVSLRFPSEKNLPQKDSCGLWLLFSQEIR